MKNLNSQIARFITSSLICSVVIFLVAAKSSAQETKLTAEQLFNPNEVVEIQIEMDPGDWDTIRHQTRSFAEALGKEPAISPYTYVKADITVNGVVIKDVGVRKKGFIGSLDERRPSLKVKFDEYVDQSPVEGLDRLTLNNNKQDPSRLMQFLAFKSFNDWGNIASRCSFAKVTVNDQYLGIYANIESIKNPFLVDRFGDDSGQLFEGTVADFYVDAIKKMEPKNNEASVESLLPLARALEPNPPNMEEVEKYLDVDAFLRFWATESLIAFWDGYTNNQNNYFCYINPENEKLYFMPWGPDAVFATQMPIPPFQIRRKSVHSQAVLANRLYRVPEIQDRYLAIMRELLDEHWNEEAINAEIDRCVELIKDDLYPENRQFESSVNAIRSFVKRRRNVIERELKRWPVELEKGPREPIYFKLLGNAEVAFDTTWFEKTPGKAHQIGNVDIQFELEGEEVKFSEVGVFSAYSEWPNPGGAQPPSVSVVGLRESDDETIILGLSLPEDQFKPGTDPVPIQGILIEGQMTFDFTKMKMISGKVTFDAAETTADAPVKGKMTLKVMQMSGGDSRD